jgi:hypothetical protein
MEILLPNLWRDSREDINRRMDSGITTPIPQTQKTVQNNSNRGSDIMDIKQVGSIQLVKQYIPEGEPIGTLVLRIIQMKDGTIRGMETALTIDEILELMEELSIHISDTMEWKTCEQCERYRKYATTQKCLECEPKTKPNFKQKNSTLLKIKTIQEILTQTIATPACDGETQESQGSKSAGE